MIEQIPLDHVEVSLADFLAVTVAVGVILADAGRSLDGAAVLERLSDKLLGAGIGNEAQAVAAQAREGGRVARLQAGMDVERRGREGAQGRGHGRPRGHVEMAKPEDLHLQGVTCHARVFKAFGIG